MTVSPLRAESTSYSFLRTAVFQGFPGQWGLPFLRCTNVTTRATLVGIRGPTHLHYSVGPAGGPLVLAIACSLLACFSTLLCSSPMNTGSGTLATQQEAVENEQVLRTRTLRKRRIFKLDVR